MKEQKILNKFEQDFNSGATIAEGLEIAFNNLPDGFLEKDKTRTNFSEIDDIVMTSIQSNPNFRRLDLYQSFEESFDKDKVFEKQNIKVVNLVFEILFNEIQEMIQKLETLKKSNQREITAVAEELIEELNSNETEIKAEALIDAIKFIKTFGA